jgi:hypothetical protein
LLVGRFVGAARLKEPPALHGKEIWLKEQDFAKGYPQQLSINAISSYDCIHVQTELILPVHAADNLAPPPHASTLAARVRELLLIHFVNTRARKRAAAYGTHQRLHNSAIGQT